MIDASPAEIVLGMILRNSDLEKALASGLKAEHFPDGFSRSVFKAILKAEAENLGISLRSVAPLLPEPEARAVLSRYVSQAPVSQNVSFYVQELRHLHWIEKTLSSVQDLGRRLLSRQAFTDIESLKLSVASFAQESSSEGTRKTVFTGAEVADLVLADVESRMLAAQKGGLVGVPTGLRNLDRLIYGWETGALYTLGARSRVGKTTSAVNFAVSAAEAGFTTALFTVEMSAKQIGKKGTSRIGELDFSQLMSGRLGEGDVSALHASLRRMASLPIVFVEASSSFEAFVAEVRRLKRTHGIRFSATPRSRA